MRSSKKGQGLHIQYIILIVFFLFTLVLFLKWLHASSEIPMDGIPKELCKEILDAS